MILLGNSYLLWIESATAGTFNFVKGQGTLSDDRSQTKIDASDKTTAGYAIGAFGNASVALSLDIKANLPDVNGYTRMESQILALTPFNIQVRKNGTAGLSTDSIFTCQVYGSLKSRKFNKDGTVDVSVEFALAAAPTVDALA